METCQMCHGVGHDRRSLNISCMYELHEVLPEAEKEQNGYHIRFCKGCRARLLRHLELWRMDCISVRDKEKDSDGNLINEDDAERNIPVRIHGGITMMTNQEYYDFLRWNNEQLFR